MFGNMDLGDMGKMLEQVQEQAKKTEVDNENKIFTAKSGGGMISISMNGKGETIDLEIDDSLMSDKDSLQILLISAMTDVTKMVEDNKKSSAMNMSGGLGSMNGMNPFGKNN